MSSIAGIDVGIDSLVSKEVSIPEPGIEIRYRKVSKVPIPGRAIKIGYRKVSIPKLVFDTSFC